MFYKINGSITEVPFEEIDENILTVGIIKGEELESVREKFGFSAESVEKCKRANPVFRTEVEVFDNYTFTELRVAAGSDRDDYIAVYLKKNLILIIDILDTDGSTMKIFKKSVERFPADRMTPAKILCSFMENLVSDSGSTIEKLRNDLVDMEEDIVHNKADNEINIELLDIKKNLLRLNNYYEQLLDIAETLSDNDNGIFDDVELIYIANLHSKISRIVNDIESLANSADHIGDAYSSSLDIKLNHSMNLFTLITTIFFPLTILVGWYGMNFNSMPEFTWKYGYIYVIALSVAIVVVMMFIGKKKKWF